MTLSSWLMAARPRTLGLSMTPVAVGATLAWAANREIHALPVLAALVGSMCIQLGTNLYNDAVDSERGGDGPARVGPPRVTAMGLLSARSVKRGAAVCFAVAALVGFYLVAVGGWPIMLLGIMSIVASWAYTGGPLPIAFTPLGELFVIAFFGVGAVGGTYWLCTAYLGSTAILAGLALGLVTGAVQLVNNARDVKADARVGRRTLAIVAGRERTSWIYAGLLLLPFRAAAADRPRSAAWSCLACDGRITAGLGVDLLLYAGATRARLQSNYGLDRANPNLVRSAAQRWIAAVM
jgi:1,4-dihydroxy-2-naphthoate octaprenyltransferase